MIDPTLSIDPKRTCAGLRTDPEWIELQHAWPRLSPTVRAAILDLAKAVAERSPTPLIQTEFPPCQYRN